MKKLKIIITVSQKINNDEKLSDGRFSPTSFVKYASYLILKAIHASQNKQIDFFTFLIRDRGSTSQLKVK
jgi:hypothetical protein